MTECSGVKQANAMGAIKDAFESKGYVEIPNFISEKDIQALKNRMAVLTHSFDIGQPLTTFDAKLKKIQSDEYFAESHNKIHYFLESEAIDEKGQLKFSKELSINKVGHGLHLKDEVFASIAKSKKIQQVMNSIGLRNPKCIQSMYIFKQPNIGAEVPWHQDATFLYTQPNSTVGLWFALEDATIENGCLCVLEQGHKLPLKQRYLRTGTNSFEFKELDETIWPVEEGVPLEVKAGTLIVLHGMLPHMSKPNRTSESRQAFTLHYIDEASYYSKNNWLKLVDSV